MTCLEALVIGGLIGGWTNLLLCKVPVKLPLKWCMSDLSKHVIKHTYAVRAYAEYMYYLHATKKGFCYPGLVSGTSSSIAVVVLIPVNQAASLLHALHEVLYFGLLPPVFMPNCPYEISSSIYAELPI